MKISIVIPCHNSAGTIGDMLESLESQHCDDYPFEIVVLDNGSTDGTIEVVKTIQNGLIT